MKKTALLVFLLAAVRPAMAYAALPDTDDGAGVSNALSLQVSADNLFDRNYAVSEGYPEAGREYVASMTYAL
jgi:outer membrane cobalamin receptor